MSERDIFLAALDLPDPANRAAFVEKACGGDVALRGKLYSLLRSHDEAGSFLGKPLVPGLDPDHAATRAFTASVENPDHPSTDSHDEALTFLAPPGRPDSLGRLGHYEVLQVLGRGGFGIVFRAFDDVLQRVVAVKVLAPQMAATSPARKRFLREARSSAQVRHENVVQVYEVGEQPLPHLVMEFIPGETLQQRLDRIGPIEPAEVVRIGRQIAEGLAAAHANDLIHRDIKPGNILLEGGQQKVKITDFGLARAADDASISQSGIIAGTPMYMAPEQAQGQPLDQRADLFSLGSVLYQMAAGRPPFRANNTVAVLKRVAEDTPRAIREIIPEVPQWLCDIIAKLHAKNPDDRYQSAREVADVLADCEAQLTANSRLKDYSRIPQGKPVVRPCRRRRKLGAAVLVILAVGLTWSVLIAEKRGWENTYHYLANESQVHVELGGMNYFDGCIIKKDGEPVGAMEQSAGGWILPPGQYQLQIRTRPGYEPESVAVDVRGYGPTGMSSVKPSNGHYGLFVRRGSVVHVSVTARVSQAGADKARLQGRWRRVSAVRYGNPPPVFDLMSVNTIEFIGDRQIADWNGKSWHGLFTLNTAADPRELDLMSADYGPTYTPVRTIYRFEGDQLVIAQGLPVNSRPTGFIDAPTAPDLTVATYVKIAMKELPPPAATLPDADIQRIAALPPLEQVEEVRKELKKRNPDFDGRLIPTIEGDAVTGLEFLTEHVTDISPVRALTSLKVLVCCGVEANGKLADLRPLSGLQLRSLDCNNTQVADLSPLKRMPLTGLYIHHTRVTELAPLTGMALEHLNSSHTFVADLTPLRGMKLQSLFLDDTKVADLTPLRGMPLRSLNLRNVNLQPNRDGAILRSLLQLEEINSEAAAEFLNKLDLKGNADK